MAIPLRPDFDASRVLAEARRSKDGPQAQRLLAMAALYDSASRTAAARIGGVTLQIVRHPVMKFNAHGADGLIDRKASGQPSGLNDTHRAALAAVVESSPTPQSMASCVPSSWSIKPGGTLSAHLVVPIQHHNPSATR
jgi:transposase